MVELDVKISAGDLYDYMLRHAYNSASGLIGSGIGALMVIYAIQVKYWIFLILGMVVILYLPWTYFIKSRQQALSNPAFQQPLHYVLDETGLTVSQGEEAGTIPWEDMVKAVSTSRSIILYTSPINATIFPKNQMGDKKAAVIEMISIHMPAAKVKIKE